KLTRAIIEVPTLETKTLPGNIFVISLYNFSGKSDALFKDAVKKFTASGSTKLIIDLRGNPGGYLDAAVDVSSWFLPAGKVVLREQIGPQRQEQIHRTTHAGISMRGVRMAILIDEGSASASEIVAGALREHGVATLVGERSFGKGSVQELAPVTRETSLKVTIERWLTPLGNSISKEGLAPDITIIPTPEDIKAGRDVQMERAVSFLLHGR
ncbi:MAG TPA: S41 family peptidase, partial [Candidatus Paceibacterota bacterium]|nr:S41 family peptidase [Candidatus Paceibacterota bacterium]